MAATKAFTFSRLSPFEQAAFQATRQDGATKVMEQMGLMQQEILAENPDNLSAKFAHVQFAIGLGHSILSSIPPKALLCFVPMNDVRFVYVDDRIELRFRSLNRLGDGKRAIYYSRLEPTLEVDGRAFMVGFARHAIQRACERLVYDWFTYAGLGDVFAFFSQNVYYEAASLLNGEQLSFSFFNRCFEPPFWQYRYVQEVLGEDNLDASLGLPYYRVGYCPAQIVENKFLKGLTILFPGYSKTPEYGALQRAALESEERQKMVDLATKSDAKSLVDNGDLSAIKWFHNNGVAQVIQTMREVYRPM